MIYLGSEQDLLTSEDFIKAGFPIEEAEGEVIHLRACSVDAMVEARGYKPAADELKKHIEFIYFQ